MSKEELTIRDRLEDILESIDLIQEWSDSHGDRFCLGMTAKRA